MNDKARKHLRNLLSELGHNSGVVLSCETLFDYGKPFGIMCKNANPYRVIQLLDAAFSHMAANFPEETENFLNEKLEMAKAIKESENKETIKH